MEKNWWDGYPWRFLQTNLREIDMLDIDAEEYVRQLKEFKANIAMINAAGIIASYPTALTHCHFQSPYLQGDSLEEIINACHKAGIKVFARTDFSKVRMPLYEQHPEWAYKSVDGHVVDSSGDVHICICGEYQQKYVLDILEEMLNKLDFDGVFFNMAGFVTKDYKDQYHGLCQCDNCKRKFQEMFGLPLPKKEDMEDPTYRKYLLFKKQVVDEYKRKVYRALKKVKPDLCICGVTDFDDGFMRHESNTALNRPLPHWQYSASDNTKLSVTSYPHMRCSNTTVDFIDFPHRHSAVSPYQQQLRLAQDLANNGGLDYYLIGRLDNHQDKSGYGPIKEMFHYHADNEDSYKGLHSLASILLLHPQDSPEYRGWVRFLTEKHFLFDAMNMDAAARLPLDDYRAVILPDCRYISDSLAHKLDTYARNGGMLIAVGQSGFYDDEYEKRPRPAFKSLGVARVNAIRDDMRSSYFEIGDEPRLDSLRETELIYLDGTYVYADYQESVKNHGKLLPPQSYGPPERCYPLVPATSLPAFTVNTFDEGSGVYIPWYPGSMYYRQGYVNTMEFIAGMLQLTLGLAPVSGDLSEMVEVTLHQGDGFRLLQLVNTSGHFGTSFFKPITISNLQLELHWDGAVHSVKALKSGSEPVWKLEGKKLSITLSSLEMLEALRIEYGPVDNL